mmetsp:Transcript_8665/g.31966  ORF Transcript_8665/g.31966 Transcript_8665/m.31966 type:complete len:245 (+) Transcript_8665:11597-12331(+)
MVPLHHRDPVHAAHHPHHHHQGIAVLPLARLPPQPQGKLLPPHANLHAPHLAEEHPPGTGALPHANLQARHAVSQSKTIPPAPDNPSCSRTKTTDAYSRLQQRSNGLLLRLLSLHNPVASTKSAQSPRHQHTMNPALTCLLRGGCPTTTHHSSQPRHGLFLTNQRVHNTLTMSLLQQSLCLVLEPLLSRANQNDSSSQNNALLQWGTTMPFPPFLQTKTVHRHHSSPARQDFWIRSLRLRIFPL